jgi:hypothetical protein
MASFARPSPSQLYTCWPVGHRRLPPRDTGRDGPTEPGDPRPRSVRINQASAPPESPWLRPVTG